VRAVEEEPVGIALAKDDVFENIARTMLANLDLDYRYDALSVCKVVTKNVQHEVDDC
jgi:hypothetical protein